MATIVVRRPPRGPAPEMPSGELVLDAPPEIPTPSGRTWTQALMMLPMVAMMAAMALMYSGSGGGGSSAMRYVTMGLFGVSMLGMVLVSLITGGGVSRRDMGQARRRYLRDLAQHRRRVARTARRQREALWHAHPEPGALWSIVVSPRLWERRRGDLDFGAVRIGVGPQDLATALVPPDTKPLEQLEPLSALALRRFITTYSTIGDLPLALAIDGFGRIHLDGDRARCVRLARAMVAQLAALQSPEDLRIAICVDRSRLADWEWLKWLPHALHPERTDRLGPVRLVAASIGALESLLDNLIINRPRFDPQAPAAVVGPHLVVIVDGGALAGNLMSGSGVEGVTVLDLTSVPPRSPDPSTLVVTVATDGTMSSGDTELGVADDMDVVAAEALARQLAPLRMAAGGGEDNLGTELGLAELLDLGDPYGFDPRTTWLPRPARDRLRVPFGILPDGTPVELDLKESAQDGMGPHGLLIGATGSGKSELLRTLVLALAITHPPNTLNFALIDFKGGATFTRLDRLPHTSAVITNLADELPLVDRMTEALNGELVRRQELLRAAGDFASLRDYEKARAAGADLPEVPTLLVICDEFSELLSARPDFIDVFVQIGRVGRSLGVHLLLASQRLEEGRLRGLDTQLSYRIGLRTFAEIDSRIVLGVSDAFTLPRAPGHGFLRYGDEPLTRFRSAYVSGVHLPPHARPRVEGAPEPTAPQEYTVDYRPVPLVVEEPLADTDDMVGESLLDILVDRFQGHGGPAHQVWLPPLAESPTLSELLGPPSVDPNRGLSTARLGRLLVIAGVVDRPLEQRRDPLLLDLSAGAGHVLVTGGPHSGKSTALRTLICGLALTHTPREVQFYCLDFGGGSLGSIRGLPHVGGVAARQNVGAVRRTVTEVAGVLAERERHFAAEEIDGMAAYRERLDGPYGDVFLVIDDWLTLRKDFEDLEDVVVGIATRGLAYGVHLVIACSRPVDVRANVRDLCGSRLELRLGDPGDSMVRRAVALAVPENAPGRGIMPSGHQMLLALPRIDGVRGTDGLTAAVSTLVGSAANAWPHEPAPAVRLLPAQVPYRDLPPRDEANRLTIGIGEQDLAPLRLDFAAEAHFLLLGDQESGKTAFLRLLARRIADSHTPEQARVILIDHRRTLLGEVGDEHLLDYGSDIATTKQIIEGVVGIAERRRPGPDVTPEQLRTRSWWQGPEVFVLVDDYDLVVSSLDNPFLPLLEFLAQGRDIGVHMVVARRTGGAGRALFEPFLSRLRDVGSPGLLLSGDREEGPLLGGLKPESLPAGRGRLVTRREAPRLLQVGWLPPAA